jgi:FkbH-like protein
MSDTSAANHVISGADVLKLARRLASEGRFGEAGDRLRDALRRQKFSPEETEIAGRWLCKETEVTSQANSIELLILGQCTTSWLASCLTAVVWGDATHARIAEGQFDNVIQELMAAKARGAAPEVVVLLPWNQRLLSRAGGRDADQKLYDELTFWKQAWDLAANQLGARVVQVGYDWVNAGGCGHHLASMPGGDVDLVRQVNAALRAALPEGAYFVDLEQVAATMGREAFYDPRRYFWTKQPFSEAGTVRLAEHFWAGVRAVTTGPKKVLVLDLDGTLWGGEVGELGPLGIDLGQTPDGEACLAFQAEVRRLAERGVVLAVASRNNPADAREPFTRNPDMLLTLADFAAFEASWEPKAAMLGRIAKTLNLGLDSFVFFDDSAAEREQVRQLCPDVAVVDVPGDPAGYTRSLNTCLWFESVTVTQADRERAAQYAAEGRRREEQSACVSIDDYLRSLEMRAEAQPIGEEQIERVVQLLAKTNQFNLTTRRHLAADVRRMLAMPGSIGLSLRAADRFGDYGLVAVLLAVPLGGSSADAAKIDTWLMSCRVIGRTFEHFLFGALLDRAASAGYGRLAGEYVPTKKNAVVAGLYDELGFRRKSESADGTIEFEINLPECVRPASFVHTGL